MKYEYPRIADINPDTGMSVRSLEWEYFVEYARMKYEQGADRAEIQRIIDEVESTVKDASRKLTALKDGEALAFLEPNDLPSIRAQRPDSPRLLWDRLDEKTYRDRLLASILGRFAGCTLGAPVEFWSIKEMKDWAEFIGQDFPPNRYWIRTPHPHWLRYEVSRTYEYEEANLESVPVDDDITYPVLCTLLLQEKGHNFTTTDAGEIWKKYLPRACTAEEVVLFHLWKGVDANVAAELDNPYQQFIGAGIRADAFGWAAPGRPEKAAEMAYRDAYLTHRRNGIYGEMYYAAVLASAFTTTDMRTALEAGLAEIPKGSLLAQDIRWALDAAGKVKDYEAARRITEAHFGGMSGVHINLNVALTLFGLLIDETDFTRVISEVTAMGFDNDCNAATAGSIFGAVKGLPAVPEYWYRPFNDTVQTYLNGLPSMKISALADQLVEVARAIYGEKE
jgi:ADP-ribosylglycohydrolase